MRPQTALEHRQNPLVSVPVLHASARHAPPATPRVDEVRTCAPTDLLGNVLALFLALVSSLDRCGVEEDCAGRGARWPSAPTHVGERCKEVNLSRVRHRLNSLSTVYQGGNSCGRLRHGQPRRIRERIAWRTGQQTSPSGVPTQVVRRLHPRGDAPCPSAAFVLGIGRRGSEAEAATAGPEPHPALVAWRRSRSLRACASPRARSGGQGRR